MQRSLSAGLTNSGMTVDQAFDGDEAESYLELSKYDVIILDVMLPKRTGLDVLQRLRAKGNRTFVLILSAKDQVEDRTRGLDLGADDYLVKPFSFDELLSRLHALQRRMSSTDYPIDCQLALANIIIDTINRTVTVNDKPIELTPSEYRILELLVTRKKQIFSHDTLIDRLYRADQSVTRNAIEAHVSSLRRKLRVAGAEKNVLTRRSFGYYIE